MSVSRMSVSRRTVLRSITTAAVLPLVAGLAACGGGDAGSGDVLRLGYFANVTHAAALIGVQEGFFDKELGDTELETQIFNAGPDVIEGLFSGNLDAAYIGPSPTINGYGQSDGDALRIIAGAASGGAQLIVQPDITSPADLEGKTLATPQLGNTQDVALRTWLTSEGLSNSIDEGGDVTIAPTANADTLTAFANKQIDGAWVPEPFASRLVLESGGKVLVDEKDLWPDGQFVTTHLIVRTEYLEDHPDQVAALLRGHVAAVDEAENDPAKAKADVNEGLEAAGGKKLDTDVLDRAWSNLAVTYDPLATSLQESEEHGVTAGTLEEDVDLDGIYDLGPLNTILADQDLEPVSAAGLGKD